MSVKRPFTLLEYANFMMMGAQKYPNIIVIESVDYGEYSSGPDEDVSPVESLPVIGNYDEKNNAFITTRDERFTADVEINAIRL